MDDIAAATREFLAPDLSRDIEMYRDLVALCEEPGLSDGPVGVEAVADERFVGWRCLRRGRRLSPSRTERGRGSTADTDDGRRRRWSVSRLGRSLVLRFDGSVRYGPDNADPRAAAVGYVVEETRPVLEGCRELSAFVSNTHVEFRALVAGARAVAALAERDRVSDVHVRGDSAAVIETVDPSRATAVGGDVCRRRAERVRELFEPVPTVTYRRVRRGENDRAHELAVRAYDRPDGG